VNAVSPSVFTVASPPESRVFSGGYRLICPYCNSSSTIRHSEQVTETVRNIYAACRNLDCGHTWKAQLSFVHTISPSAVPRPDLHLPKCPDDYEHQVFPAGARKRRADSGADYDQPTFF
jgi:Ogr/Delta-like zinc finger